MFLITINVIIWYNHCVTRYKLGGVHLWGKVLEKD